MARYIGVFLAFLLLLLDAGSLDACTSVIFSGRATKDGRPLMWKNRDAGCLDNRLAFFRGRKYSYTGLVNSPSVEPEVWIGMNEAGFSIMNTASYNIKDDNVPQSEMDKEGKLMAEVLGVCAKIEDFEHYLDTCARPMGVEAEFGVIDAFGGAAYFEVNNHSFIKFDVNSPEVAPEGYMVVTNFSFTGREKDRKGVERYETASSIFEELAFSGMPYDILPEDIFNSLSRSLRNERMKVDYMRDFQILSQTGAFSGIVADLDFIPRRSTSASVVIHGAADGGNPLHTVMWAVVGYPFTSVAIPVPLADEDLIPDCLKSSEASANSALCDLSLSLKNKFIFRFKGSNGDKYMDISTVADGSSNPLFPALVLEAESVIREGFTDIYNQWISGRISTETFRMLYRILSSGFYNEFFVRTEPFI